MDYSVWFNNEMDRFMIWEVFRHSQQRMGVTPCGACTVCIHYGPLNPRLDMYGDCFGDEKTCDRWEEKE